MEKQTATNGMKKRQLISAANRTVFAWIIAASIVIGICGVVVQFLARQFIFNSKVYAAVSATNKTLEANIAAYDGLKADVTKLVADTNLAALRKGENSTPLQVIIDALPTEESRSALATSMQSEVVGPSGVTINTFTVSGDNGGGSGAKSSASGSVGSFDFNFSVTGTYDQVKQMFKNIERSIRPITVQAFQVRGTDKQLQIVVTATTYFQPPKQVMLKEKQVKP